MAVVLATAQTQCTSLLAACAATTYSSTVDDDGTHASEIAEAVLETDASVCLAIVMTPGHPRQPDFMAVSATLAYGAELPTAAGRVAAVEIDRSAGAGNWVPARHASISRILAWRENLGSIYTPGAASDYSGYYEIVGHQLYYTGPSGAFARVYAPTYTRTAACQSPDEYYPVVVHGALASLLGKEGHDPSASQFYAELYKGGMEMVVAGAGVVPPIVEYQSQR